MAPTPAWQCEELPPYQTVPARPDGGLVTLPPCPPFGPIVPRRSSLAIPALWLRAIRGVPFSFVVISAPTRGSVPNAWRAFLPTRPVSWPPQLPQPIPYCGHGGKRVVVVVAVVAASTCVEAAGVLPRKGRHSRWKPDAPEDIQRVDGGCGDDGEAAEVAWRVVVDVVLVPPVPVHSTLVTKLGAVSPN